MKSNLEIKISVLKNQRLPLKLLVKKLSVFNEQFTKLSNVEYFLLNHKN